MKKQMMAFVSRCHAQQSVKSRGEDLSRDKIKDFDLCRDRKMKIPAFFGLVISLSFPPSLHLSIHSSIHPSIPPSPYPSIPPLHPPSLPPSFPQECSSYHVHSQCHREIERIESCLVFYDSFVPEKYEQTNPQIATLITETRNQNLFSANLGCSFDTNKQTNKQTNEKQNCNFNSKTTQDLMLHLIYGLGLIGFSRG